jgi:hypothetical protein
MAIAAGLVQSSRLCCSDIRLSSPAFVVPASTRPWTPCRLLPSGLRGLRLSLPAINWAAQDTIRDDRKQRRGEQELQRPARIHCLARRAFPRRESPSTNARSDRPRLSAQGRGHRTWTRQSAAARPAAHGCAHGAERARCNGFHRSHARSSASEILVPRPPAMAPAVPASIGPTPPVVAVSATAPNASPRQDSTARNEGPRSPTERRQSWTSPMSCQTSYAKNLQRHRLAASPRSNLQTKGSPSRTSPETVERKTLIAMVAAAHRAPRPCHISRRRNTA